MCCTTFHSANNPRIIKQDREFIEYLKLQNNTSFKLRDKLIDREWNITESVNFEKFPKCGKNFITYYIKSHYTNGFDRRKTIRETWGVNKTLVFIAFGKNTKTKPRDANFDDILLTNSYSENADLLAVKIALGVHHANFCNNSHATFTDDDVYFFANRFEKMVENKWVLEKTVSVLGKVHKRDGVIRRKYGRWSKYYQSYEEYPYSTFPEFANGAGYIASKLAIAEIYKTVPFTRLLRHLDDAYFGLLCWDSGVRMENDDNFTTGQEHVTKGGKYPCGLYNLHGFRLIEKFVEIRNKQCEHPTQFRVDKNNWMKMIDPDNSLTKNLLGYKPSWLK